MSKIFQKVSVLFATVIVVSAFLHFFITAPPFQKHALNGPFTGLYDKSEESGKYRGQAVNIPKEKISTIDSNVLGSKSDKKRIEIDLSEQKIRAYEGDKKVYSFKVSTGKWGRTPTGEFRIWTKLRYTLMTGGNQAWGTYYYLPNVPFVMYFHGNGAPKSKGYGIHGTYWHDNFGHPMSHGCINMKTEEAEQLFYWANPVITNKQNVVYADGENTGTKIIIYGEAPNT